MNDTFEQEWKLYREGGARRPFEADRPEAAVDPATPFDAAPRRGELRIFADMRRPFVALLAEDRGAAGWLVVPVSPFTVPASPRERRAGARVFQLWNACVASRRFVERSWRVDALAEADVADLAAAAAKASPGRVGDGENAVAQYEREFLVAGGNFTPLFRREPARPLFLRPAFRAAAALAICCGLAVYAAKMGTKDRPAGEAGAPVLVGDAAPADGGDEARSIDQADLDETAEADLGEECEEEDVASAPPPAPARAEELDNRIRVAKECYATGLYDDSRREVENVLQDDPGRADALDLQRRLDVRAKMDADAGKDKRSVREGLIKDVTSRWTPRTYSAEVSGDCDGLLDYYEAAAAAAAPDGTYGGLYRVSFAEAPAGHLGGVRSWKDSGLVVGGGLDIVGGSLYDVSTAGMVMPAAERYAEFSENEFLDPKATPLSTFSLDVDTTSYALMRRELTDGRRLPPRTSVRLEEFVNYFRYDYPQPADGRPLAVSCEAAPCPWNPAHRLARVALQARKLDKGNIPPCNLVFLVDVSGSMSWHGGIEMAKKGLSMLVGELRDEDRVAIVTYANGTDVRLPSTPGTDKARILAVIDSLMAGGGTAGGAGIRLAYEEARKNFDAKRNNRVVLVTDGDFNIGISSPKELEDFIAEKRASGVFLTVVGVGEGNYHDAAMKKLANAGNGNYAYVDSLLEAKKVFLTEFGGTLQTVAKDVKLQVEFNPAQVAAYRLLGYENRTLADQDFNADRKDAGEIGSGHSMTAFYEIVPAGSGEEAVASVDPLKYQRTEGVESGDLFTVKLRWKAPDGDASELAETPFAAAAATDSPSEDFRFASAVAEYALLLEGSKFKGTASFSNVLSRARAAKGSDPEGWRAEFIRLVEAAELYAR